MFQLIQGIPQIHRHFFQTFRLVCHLGTAGHHLDLVIQNIKKGCHQVLTPNRLGCIGDIFSTCCFQAVL